MSHLILGETGACINDEEQKSANEPRASPAVNLSDIDPDSINYTGVFADSEACGWLTSMEWLRRGDSTAGTMITSCGHGMHLTCVKYFGNPGYKIPWQPGYKILWQPRI